MSPLNRGHEDPGDSGEVSPESLDGQAPAIEVVAVDLGDSELVTRTG